MKPVTDRCLGCGGSLGTGQDTCRCMTPQSRHAFLMAPISFSIIGGRGWGGTCLFGAVPYSTRSRQVGEDESGYAKPTDYDYYYE
jgi:hypothetical protein